MSVDQPDRVSRPAAGTSMKNRWKLNRAGILNVYQYGDETIDLAGGRLLLRGVNGSGKSTAMNMLLPFLIEADVSRIDAAGEQTGMLRSWVLSGREEPNPVGYLWIEFERLDAGTGEIGHLVCGCGIRASSSTDRRTHVVVRVRPASGYRLFVLGPPNAAHGGLVANDPGHSCSLQPRSTQRLPQQSSFPARWWC